MNGEWFVSKGRLEDVLSFAWNMKNSSKFITFLRFLGNYFRFKVSQSNTSLSSRDNIRRHYDDDGIDNLLFQSILDNKMMYSSGLFRNSVESLDSAQENKISYLLEQLDLQSGDDVLEIGGGWGTLLFEMSKRAGSVVGLTLSMAQLSYFKSRCESKSKLEYHLMDYRDYFVRNPRKKFDKIVCVEALDHVGLKQFGAFFDLLKDHLAPEGKIVFQLILRPEAGQTSKWIDKYVYPGGYIASRKEVVKFASESGFNVAKFDDVGGAHYAETLSRWKENLHAKRDEISEKAPSGISYYNKWDFFLAYSKSSFENAGFSTAFMILEA